MNLMDQKLPMPRELLKNLGADIVKVNYSGSVKSFKEVINGVKIPVLIAGGEKMTSDEAILTMIKESIQAGAKGVSIGRNVFQHSDATSLSIKIREILDQE